MLPRPAATENLPWTLLPYPDSRLYSPPEIKLTTSYGDVNTFPDTLFSPDIVESDAAAILY